ncbi:MAG: asparagine synthase (glutamine-hydrolyzing) [Ignavibacteria bacterium]|jgi:asparagine synthase (glutamine-hydrolysing)|nr:asparagine synthase (glutamine-hydrolyzing) [Ignavibacteria bacterium]MCU7502361.1 asparagine synthase (glutamine-hydrolyzing) [Ignavibacteria bacterium]MCU7515074.1 asparagine synthase (glutamine-hydrolyzing) [Ignavibacteria bacterium]
MCGIFGVFNFKNHSPIDQNLLRQSTRLMSHRGPDGEGYFVDQNSGVGLGHRRLSIIDLATGDQPMCNEDETIWITFNGEIYNYQEIKNYLLKKGHVFRSKSDTEVLIHAYEEFGDEFLSRLNGIFAFAIWDSVKRRMLLARDHFGVKPLYYYVDGEKLVFASELKSILYYTKVPGEINPASLNLCLTFRHTPAPYTLLDKINKLPATNFLTIGEKEGFCLKPYWDRAIEIDSGRSEAEWIEVLRNGLELAVKRQMMSDVPVGISLSGGIDSGSILALMSRYVGRGVHAFTIGFEGGKEENNEIKRAEANAAMFGAVFHHRVITAKDYSDFLKQYLWHLEEPLGNESAVAVYFVTELAKGTVKVLLNGQGADEPFGGYDRHLGAFYRNRYSFLKPQIMKYILMLPISLNKKKKLSRFADFLGQDSDLKRITSAACILNYEERKKIFNSELFEYSHEEDYENEVEKILHDSIHGSTVEKMFLYDMFSSLSENLLLVQDKMAMAASIEGRVPFLDVEFASTALSIPATLKIKGKSGKYIHKKVCEYYLPKDIVHQRKIGFQDPVELWLKDSLGDELLDYLNSQNSITKNYLNKKAVDRMFYEHRHNKADHKRFLYLLLSIEKWAEIFLAPEKMKMQVSYI